MTQTTNIPVFPYIAPRTAAALCHDEYTGAEAMAGEGWDGASETSRVTHHEGWTFCLCVKTNRIEAQDEDGNGAYAQANRSAWDAY
ncbi:MAG: hypothetical protein CMP20_04045 [Rickettsiales bacterium]|nr:hypothetical protein [Rickettsiales bacterium]